MSRTKTLGERAASMIEALYNPGPIPGPAPTKLDYEIVDLCEELRRPDKAVKIIEDLVKYGSLALQQTADWNAAVERVIGRQPKTGIDTNTLSLALMAAQNFLTERKEQTGG